MASAASVVMARIVMRSSIWAPTLLDVMVPIDRFYVRADRVRVICLFLNHFSYRQAEGLDRSGEL